jgi:hypothetical protein
MRVYFEDVEEIRMGSPYNICDVRITGAWVPDIDLTEFQDLVCYSMNGAVGLVRWDITPENDPGFRVIIACPREKQTHESAHIAGCCEKIRWEDDSVAWCSTSGESGMFSGDVAKEDK